MIKSRLVGLGECLALMCKTGIARRILAGDDKPYNSIKIANFLAIAAALNCYRINEDYRLQALIGTCLPKKLIVSCKRSGYTLKCHKTILLPEYPHTISV
jgi:hypothetical protein